MVVTPPSFWQLVVVTHVTPQNQAQNVAPNAMSFPRVTLTISWGVPSFGQRLFLVMLRGFRMVYRIPT